jgi:hypothetical protein
MLANSLLFQSRTLKEKSILNKLPVRPFRSILLTLFILAGCTTAPVFARERDWRPEKTWVFVVGVLEWKQRDMFASFPKENRRDAQLVRYFRQQGVPDRQIMYLQDREATSRQVANSFPNFLSQARPGDMLFFYYTGHGYKSEDARATYFATYDAGDYVRGWSTESIVRDIEKYFGGSRALLAADTCYSGSLTTQVQRFGRRVSFASLSSASADQLSTENWTFTEMLLASLRGQSFADTDNDGEITLGELAENIQQDMSFAENQRSTFTTTGDFQSAIVLSSAEKKTHPFISRRVEVRSDGDWFKARVINVRGNKYQVHYYGWDEWYDEWVTARQIRHVGSAYANGPGAGSNSNDKPANGWVTRIAAAARQSWNDW